VDLARQAIKEYGGDLEITVAGSISPYGAVLHDLSEYTGTYIDTVSREVCKLYCTSREKTFYNLLML